MFCILSVVASVAFAAIASATTIPLTPVNRTSSLLGLPAAERLRATYFKTRDYAAGSTTTVPATQLAYVQYTLSVGVGSPPTYYSIVLDTGSSNTFVGCVLPQIIASRVLKSQDGSAEPESHTSVRAPVYRRTRRSTSLMALASSPVLNVRRFPIRTRRSVLRFYQFIIARQ